MDTFVVSFQNVQSAELEELIDEYKEAEGQRSRIVNQSLTHPH